MSALKLSQSSVNIAGLELPILSQGGVSDVTRLHLKL